MYTEKSKIESKGLIFMSHLNSDRSVRTDWNPVAKMPVGFLFELRAFR